LKKLKVGAGFQGKQKPRSSKRGLNGAPSGSFWSLTMGNKKPAQAKEA
jgi:hypothetical protein